MNREKEGVKLAGDTLSARWGQEVNLGEVNLGDKPGYAFTEPRLD